MSDPNPPQVEAASPSPNRRPPWVRYVPVIVVVVVAIGVIALLPSVSGDDDPGDDPAPTTAAPELVGENRLGVECGPDVRQVEWSKYSAMCVPEFDGDNGGATATGVSAAEIVVSARVSDSGLAAAVAAASPSLNTAAQEAYQQDLAVYIDYFNTQFELYGRQVRFEPYAGQGDWVSEYQGQNLAGAQSDAATAASMGSFADLSNGNVASTPAFAQALADNQVVSAGGVGGSQSFFEEFAPYVYTTASTTTDLAGWVGDTACRRMVGLDAVFAGDADMQGTERVFGLLYPSNPDFRTVGTSISDQLSECGSAPAATFQYALDLGSLAVESTNAIAQMLDAGVTTIICACDNVSPRFFTEAAQAQGYSPEWVGLTEAALLARNFEPEQWSRAIVAANGTVDPTSTEAYSVYLEASGGTEPRGEAFPLAYAAALLFFNTVQNAGPDLTPQTYKAGFAGLPDSLPDGDMGPWSFSEDSFAPRAGIATSWFDPTAQDSAGVDGVYVRCSGEDATTRTFGDPESFGPEGTQLECRPVDP